MHHAQAHVAAVFQAEHLAFQVALRIHGAGAFLHAPAGQQVGRRRVHGLPAGDDALHDAVGAGREDLVAHRGQGGRRQRREPDGARLDPRARGSPLPADEEAEHGRECRASEDDQVGFREHGPVAPVPVQGRSSAVRNGAANPSAMRRVVSSCGVHPCASAIVAVPVRGPSGTIVGALGSSVYLDSLSLRIKRQLALGPGQIFYSIDSTPIGALQDDPEQIFLDPYALNEPELERAIRLRSRNCSSGTTPQS